MGGSSPDDIDWDDPPFELTDVDRELLATADEDFPYISWERLKDIIANNKLEELRRTPYDTRRYLAWKHDVSQNYEDMNDFVIKERLYWKPTSSPGDPPTFTYRSDVPFEDWRDYCILINDWPYGYEKGISHLVVWSRTPIAVDEEQGGDVTDQSRRLIEDFVDRHFIKIIGEDGAERVQWFKNWTSLQSVRGVDHVHILLRNVPDDLQKDWMKRRDLETS